MPAVALTEGLGERGWRPQRVNFLTLVSHMSLFWCIQVVSNVRQEYRRRGEPVLLPSRRVVAALLPDSEDRSLRVVGWVRGQNTPTIRTQGTTAPHESLVSLTSLPPLP